ncbi:hypothetical protein CCYS_09915 [Corynebacterium cystitidis DSM 20524]|uniref:Uncharacterized protein n=1 Tax=Corynebacterium cystitidis DSM 20524 TaxID=1121357 RepID=A0A1H9VN25_9CORY|nr:hypothetical protein CCYS_09915 [Corynebacterium cystitidis DSM 20524]SES22941.1 hypothetical protein SAMN05661109_02306 [Corynebacterium cystitidis DSM 20524]SNV69327.1 Uncharacterised protein [Corynebacterium cystitidis]
MINKVFCPRFDALACCFVNHGIHVAQFDDQFSVRFQGASGVIVDHAQVLIDNQPRPPMNEILAWTLNTPR